VANSALHNNFSIIPHATKKRILLLAGNDGWTLPKHSHTDPLDIAQAMKQLLNVDVTVLECVYDRCNEVESTAHHQVYVLENHGPDWTPPSNGRWVGLEELDHLLLAVPEHYYTLKSWLIKAEDDELGTQQLPWTQFGWFDIAYSWIGDQLNLANCEVVGPIEQVTVSIWGSVLRIFTTAGIMYFKASAPAFAYEPALTQMLAQIWPLFIPRVFAIESKRHWMLMEDAGQLLSDVAQIDTDMGPLERMLPLYARIQIESVNYLEEFKELGCPDRRLDKLSILLEKILEDKSSLLLGQEDGVSYAEYEKIWKLTEKISTACTELRSYNIPETLHHDDLHTSNIAVTGQRYMFVDWAESGLTHPFFSLGVLLRQMKRLKGFDFGPSSLLCQSYLEPWTRYEPMERLVEAFRLAQWLSPILRALTWHSALSQVDNERHHQYKSAIPFILKDILYSEGGPE